jgi:hypothetical protein
MDEIETLDAWNVLFATLHARSKDSPGKTFWDARAMHPAIFRALRMDPNEEGAIYAAAAFRLHLSADGPRVLCAMPALRILEDGNDDWLDIEAVLSWNPVDDTATVMGDAGADLFGHTDAAEPLNVYSSPFDYLRHVAEARAQWFIYRAKVNGEWHLASEPARIPGLLALAEPAKVRWPLHDMPADITAHGIDARAFNNALLRQARIPRAVAAPQSRKAA